MKFSISLITAGLALALSAGAQALETVQVTTDNFVRAESDLYFAAIAKDNGFGKFNHTREMAPVDKQNVIRLNRDTLYSSAVFDLDAGPVTITLPDPGKRFMSMQVINEDHFTPNVIYKAGTYTFDKDTIGTRYVVMAVRTFANPADAADLKQAHALQDGISAKQPNGSGKFEIPQWDQASQKNVRDALLSLNASLPDTNGMFGKKTDINPIRHLIGSASGWGGNPQTEATYLNVTPEKNDGKTIYRLSVKDVPVDGFWSISVYNAQGYYAPNKQNAYTLNNITAKKGADGTVDVQFGGCDGKVSNCLPTVAGWNYMVRLYRPQATILDGSWSFPQAKPLQ
ncbi:DUF1254 domain-containing protein [Pseudomonas sp. 5P_3.1_Bac2]|uniref:DUF1254 domain-containing protein n=1 Tax=Pseudomonas sp. 5P_3.1_Bac2 TaxID=2971617 RepID=UPI0021C75DE0|nr:DUF1254 domain-containing protein [Pseudomonas sp. 5P_3.1_Bac2]MCU1717761.1 DUF1254 domain-containing protein [Pseudomonas sp. 5P_3.1_Bac2]